MKMDDRDQDTSTSSSTTMDCNDTPKEAAAAAPNEMTMEEDDDDVDDEDMSAAVTFPLLESHFKKNPPQPFFLKQNQSLPQSRSTYFKHYYALPEWNQNDPRDYYNYRKILGPTPAKRARVDILFLDDDDDDDGGEYYDNTDK